MTLLTLRYGGASTIQFIQSQSDSPIHCGEPAQPSLADPMAAVTAALEQPLDFPPLAQTATPGDRVVLACDAEVPQLPEIIAAVVRCLMGAGIGPDGITVLRTKTDRHVEASHPCHLLPPDVQERITVVAHDPQQRNQMAYLATSESGEPIVLNRALTDADIVLPIGCITSRKEVDYHGIHGTVYPTFSDAEAQAQFRSLKLLNHRIKDKKRLVKQCNDVGWLLGLNFTIQVVPGPGDRILHVLAGQYTAVRRQGRDLYQAAWTSTVPSQASLAVVAIEGGASQQTWHHFGRALATAESLVEDGGAIAVCCELATPPGAAVQRLVRASSRPEALKAIAKDRPEDALVAAQLADALDRGEVYLLSRLDETLVEDLEMAPLVKPDDLVRLVQRHPSCIVVSNSPYAVVNVEGEDW